VIARKLQTWFRLSRRERRLAISGMAVVAFARLALWVLPFRVLQRMCQGAGPVSRPGGQADVQQIAWAVRIGSRYVPRATCLVQALATQLLLRRHGHAGRVHIGVARDAKLGFSAHAWVESEGQILSGASEDLDRYVPMLILDNDGLPR
jgi:Transglutaminase-like superfamily